MKSLSAGLLNRDFFSCLEQYLPIYSDKSDSYLSAFNQPLYYIKDFQELWKINPHFSVKSTFLIKLLSDQPVIFQIPVKNPSFQNLYGLKLLVSFQNSTKSLLPLYLQTVVNYLQNGGLEVLKPGLISHFELNKLSDKNFSIVKNYHSDFKLDFPVKLVSDVFSQDFSGILLASTEQIKLLQKKTNFSLNTKKIRLINIGSLANPKNLVFTLPKKILALKKNFPDQSLYLYQPVWPKNHWGEILRYLFDKN